MEPKFTYLIGAGASANVLPVVNQFAKRIKTFRREFHTELKNLKILMHWDPYLDELQALISESEKFGTIDTLAKYYYLKDKSKLFKLKKILSTYFVLEQSILKKQDNRYLIFLTTIMNGIKLPKKIKLLTWNYDFQFELAATNFVSDNGASNLGGNTVRSGTLINYVPDSGIFNRIEHANNIDLLHLNGTAGFYLEKDKRFVFSSFHHMGGKRKLTK